MNSGSRICSRSLFLRIFFTRTGSHFARKCSSRMNLTFGTRSTSTSRPNVKLGNSTRIINILVVLLFPTFALGADTSGMQMLETNH
ncbi:hypothetical protein CHELA40_12835 [Chelatococcus asaccharovorans]|nr:hypothetical protein CHELA40_12835 [Chelatococcus asaccharovorans]